MQISGKKQKQKQKQRATAGVVTESSSAGSSGPKLPIGTGSGSSTSSGNAGTGICYTTEEEVTQVMPGMVILRHAVPTDVQSFLAKEAFRFSGSIGASSCVAVGVGVTPDVPGGSPSPQEEHSAASGSTGSTCAQQAAYDSGFYSVDPRNGVLRLNQGARGRLIVPVEELNSEVTRLCSQWVNKAHQIDSSIPVDMVPTMCLMNYYHHDGRFKWHVDSEHPDDVRHNTGPPIVSVTIGDSCEFGIKPDPESEAYRSVILNSGDVLLFGGPARMVPHSVLRIIPTPRPVGLVGMPPKGRLNITLRDVRKGSVDPNLFPMYRVSYA